MKEKCLSSSTSFCQNQGILKPRYLWKLEAIAEKVLNVLFGGIYMPNVLRFGLKIDAKTAAPYISLLISS